MSNPFVAGESSLWVQVEGANSRPDYLGCHQVDDIEIPRGDVTLLYCPDESGPNKFKVVGSFQGAPDAPTTSITTDVAEVCDFMEKLTNPVPIYINKFKSGRRDIFGNYLRGFILVNARITNVTLAGLAARTPDDQTRSEQTFDLSAESVLTIFRPSTNRQSIAATGDLFNISFCDATCKKGYAAGDSVGSAGTAQLWLTENGGADWDAAAAEPFAADEDVRGLVCFELGQDTQRVLVGRGTADGANPAEIAYSDDDGATWVNVNVGAVTGQYVNHQNGIFALDWTHIWVVTRGGYVYFSSNGGASFTAQESGALTVQHLNAVHFLDADNGWAGGVANVLMKTSDGGDSWELVTGPSAMTGVAVSAVRVVTKNRVWVGYSDGSLWFTENGGTSWEERTFSGEGTGSIAGIVFYNELVGIIAHNSATPVGVVLRTIDGGHDWETVQIPNNNGLNSVSICGPNDFFGVGAVIGGTALVTRGTGC